RPCPSGSSALILISTPMRRARSGCCACAESGHVTAAPPKSAMKSRRLMEITPQDQDRGQLYRDQNRPAQQIRPLNVRASFCATLEETRTCVDCRFMSALPPKADK